MEVELKIVCMKCNRRKNNWQNFQPVCQFSQNKGPYHHSSHEGRHSALHCIIGALDRTVHTMTRIQRAPCSCSSCRRRDPIRKLYLRIRPLLCGIQAKNMNPCPMSQLIFIPAPNCTRISDTVGTGQTIRHGWDHGSTWHYQSRHFQAACHLCCGRNREPQN